MDALGEQWTTESAHKFVAHFYRRQADLFFLAEVNGVIIGAIVAAIQPWWDGNHLVEGEIFLDPEYQDGDKLAQKALIRKLVLTARSKYHIVAWDTLMPIIGKHTFGSYEAIGFQEMPHIKAMSADVGTLLARLGE